ncbi:MAG: hypothetical protein FRX49_11862 [Trebouxia sp. A1-2]|nr:MAG: hypothetical protein FRX49_11862 [Trebouxia sp. A1-2]
MPDLPFQEEEQEAGQQKEEFEHTETGRVLTHRMRNAAAEEATATPTTAATAMPAIAPEPMPALAVWPCPVAAPRALEFAVPGAGTGAEAPGAGALAGSCAPFAGDKSGPKALLAAICSADCEEFAAAGVRETAGVAAGLTSGVAVGVGTAAGVAAGLLWFGRIAVGLGELDGAAGAVSFPAAERVSFPKAGEGTRLGRPTPGGWAGLKALPTDIVPLIGRVPLEGADKLLQEGSLQATDRRMVVATDMHADKTDARANGPSPGASPGAASRTAPEPPGVGINTAPSRLYPVVLKPRSAFFSIGAVQNSKVKAIYIGVVGDPKAGHKDGHIGVVPATLSQGHSIVNADWTRAL